jgi:UDP-N-acetylmuramoyl-L-alanyl-D-glutamate--2,6-diaminopimelate ligase
MSRLDEVLDDLEVTKVVGDPHLVDVASVAHDSRVVTPGSLFCCVRGEQVDGHDFARAAADAGAVALLCDRELDLAGSPPVVQVVVADVRRAMGPAAAVVHGHPSRDLEIVGVTGTNGKTTTTHLLRSVLDAAGRPAGLIGTLTGVRTTPEAPDLQAELASLRSLGRRAVAMEVSSHALAQHRVDGTTFRVAVFTNLSRDHLDFHVSMEDYFRAKARLFTPELAARGVVCVDDRYGRLLRDAARIPTVVYSMADAEDVEIGVLSSRFRWRGVDVEVPLGGRFNVVNAIAAATAAAELGIAAGDVAAGLATAGPIAGRFEPVDAGQPFRVLVDYAHTPDGLEQLLRAAREVAGGGTVTVVFGCGGDRDPTKRPEMGAVAAMNADRVVVTSDNPRTENPDAIIAAIVDGIPSRSEPERAGSLVVEPDRAKAIVAALESAVRDDVVVIAGKGHETTQTIDHHEIPFDDRVVARHALQQLGARSQW